MLIFKKLNLFFLFLSLNLCVIFDAFARKTDGLRLSSIVDIQAVASGENETGFKDGSSTILADGNWGKISVASSGVYRISYEYLRSNGLLNSPVPSSQIGVFGQGSGSFGYSTAIERSSDLYENNIQMHDGGDGEFGAGDFVLFYAQGPDEFEYKSGDFNQIKNVYDRASYYFITAEKGNGVYLTIQEDSVVGNHDLERNFHNFLSVYENDIVNIGKTGRSLFGEAFEFNTKQTFQVQTRNPISGESVNISVVGAGKGAGGNSVMKITVNGQSINKTLVPESGYVIYSGFTANYAFSNLAAGNVNVEMSFSKFNASAKAWLDYIKLSVKTSDNLNGGVYHLEPFGADSQKVAYTQFINPNNSYWLVNEYGNFTQLKIGNVSGVPAIFLNGNTYNKVVELTGTDYPAPSFNGKVSNQNLHSISNVDYIIVYPPVFEGPANRLADFHRSRGLDVVTVDVNKIYTEFSSGARSVIGIRDFFKHVWDKDPSKLKYVLLFGDGSYHNLDGHEGNTNFLPTYQSVNSIRETASFVTDDFFGFLEDNEGAQETNATRVNLRSSDMDIGLGRFPVSNLTEANTLVDKVIRYTTGPAEEIYGDWRNNITFVTDDQSGESGSNGESFHITDANAIAEYTASNNKEIEISKIYADAYIQESTPGGSRYPTVNKLIKERVQNGAFLVNYTGHGGEVGWAHERILDLAAINSWTNKYKMPLVVTATCEFSRFDDYERTSAGEFCLLNPNGGAIALLSTTRVVFAGANARLNMDFFQNLFARNSDGSHARLGDIYKLAKRQFVASESGINHLNFSLLGDPALELAFPKNVVNTTKINGQDFASFQDTIKALSLVTLEGEISNTHGERLTDFNGEVFVRIYDKEVQQETYGNDGASPIKFKTRNSFIYKGAASVVNGEFSLQFIVPKDIQFQEGNGLIQYYANSDATDANGASDNIVIGGISDNAIADNKGPDIDLFFNDYSFRSGDETGENPDLIAELFDESGINTTGAGIGHDIIAFIDGDIKNGVTLNNLYRSQLNSYKAGGLQYAFEGLTPGDHVLTLRAWDNNNNPSEANLAFMVRSADDPILEELLAYPNPAMTETTIKFDHNQGGFATEAVLEILDMQGRVVVKNTWALQPLQKGTATYTWNLKNAAGNAINTGSYVYRVTLNSDSGRSVRATNKLLVVR